MKLINFNGAKLASTPLRSLKNSLICSCTLFTRAIIRGGVDPDTAYNLSDVIIQQIEKFEDYNKLQDFEVKMVHTFIDTFRKGTFESLFQHCEQSHFIYP